MAAGQVIGCPRPDQIDAVGQGFAQLARHPAFQNAVGAIDGCHIRIKPLGFNKDDYFNYRQFYNIQMQAVCHSTGQFLNIFVGYPGSVYTCIVKTAVYCNAEYPPPGNFLQGDCGYPCTDKPIQVFTPLKMPYKDQWRRVPFTIIE